MLHLDLSQNWLLRYEDLWIDGNMNRVISNRREGWLSTALPCDIHMPLIQHEIIQEPLIGLNCFDCKWVEDKSWWFKKLFTVDAAFLDGDRIELTLESLDGDADVFLNGVHLGCHRSAFYPFERDVKAWLVEGENELFVRMTTGLERVCQADVAPVQCEMTVWPSDRHEKRRMLVRKPQYAFGWDHVPRVATCGITRGAWLESRKTLSVRTVHAVTTRVSPDAEVSFKIEIDNLHPYATVDGKVTVSVYNAGDVVLDLQHDLLLKSGLNFVHLAGIIQDARLWWPHGMGEAHLYTVNVTVTAGATSAVYPPFKFGLRTININMDRISLDERRFTFEINGVSVFAKGADWVPADSIYARVSDSKYETLISEAKEANFNMIRIWGGGNFEKDIFYELCDQNGIMIWHDFMFACAVYPDNLVWFSQEVENETNYQTRRLRNHPCMTLWCGNNEIPWLYIGKCKGADGPLDFGGATTFNYRIPAIIHNNCPEIPYWNSSPYGGDKPNSESCGNRHVWEVAMNKDIRVRASHEAYRTTHPKFVSEYGCIGPSRRSSIETFLNGAPFDRHDRVYQYHVNLFEKDTTAALIARHYADSEAMGMDDYILYGGLCQGLMLEHTLSYFRSYEHCWGTLFWDYSDSWGETGWTIIDYYLKRKIAYYFVKRAFAHVRLILDEADGGRIRVIGYNDTPYAHSFSAEYGYITFDGRTRQSSEAHLTLPPFSRGVVLEFGDEGCSRAEGCFFVWPSATTVVQPAILRTPEIRNLRLPSAELEVSDFARQDQVVSFTVRSSSFAHAVHFDLDDALKLSDEFFDLLPGEVRRISVYGISSNINFEDIKPRAIASKESIRNNQGKS